MIEYLFVMASYIIEISLCLCEFGSIIHYVQNVKHWSFKFQKICSKWYKCLARYIWLLMWSGWNVRLLGELTVLHIYMCTLRKCQASLWRMRRKAPDTRQWKKRHDGLMVWRKVMSVNRNPCRKINCHCWRMSLGSLPETTLLHMCSIDFAI